MKNPWLSREYKFVLYVQSIFDIYYVTELTSSGEIGFVRATSLAKKFVTQQEAKDFYIDNVGPSTRSWWVAKINGNYHNWTFSEHLKLNYGSL